MASTAFYLRRRWRRRRGSLGCRAELAQDAPFAAAIGACILNSLVFPVAGGGGDEDGDSVMDSTDARFAVMGIISFIPYFNWLELGVRLAGYWEEAVCSVCYCLPGSLFEGKKKEHGRLPSAQEQSRNELRGWHILEKQSDEHFSDDGDVTGKSKDKKH
ncbi:hypothetical protein Syun_019857 [Stephania yunnanensis]|uniref:Uncharacterized protein n=1 Tax=Stephania yunnanensis TaxID=152371 RepID=A0AAP0IVL5_9MAGN